MLFQTNECKVVQVIISGSARQRLTVVGVSMDTVGSHVYSFLSFSFYPFHFHFHFLYATSYGFLRYTKQTHTVEGDEAIEAEDEK